METDKIIPRTALPMFAKFVSQDERKKYGTCFIEIQFYKAPVFSEDAILDCVKCWENDSLYVYDDYHSPLYTEYKDVFGYGIRANKSEGYFDSWGITYYKPEQIDGIISRANEVKPDGYETLVEWLTEAKKYNGFFICGV